MQVASPFESRVWEPPAQLIGFVPSTKETLPVGLAALVVPVTVAVSDTGWPRLAGVGGGETAGSEAGGPTSWPRLAGLEDDETAVIEAAGPTICTSVREIDRLKFASPE